MEVVGSEPSSSTSSGRGNPNTAPKPLGTQTYNLLKQVIQGLHNELNRPQKTFKEPSHLAARLTGFPASTFVNIDSKINSLYGKELERRAVHYALMNFCIRRTKYPDCFELLTDISADPQLLLDMQTFIRNLTEMGYVLRKRQGKLPYVCEKPEVAFERFLYLRKVKKYRSEKRRIFYIGEASVSSGSSVLSYEETIAYGKNSVQPPLPFFYIVCNESPKKNILCTFRVTEELNSHNFMKWIQDDILAGDMLDDNSVIVLDNSEHHNDTVCSPLTSLNESLKSEIREWLEHHRIPFTDNMSKRQLWKLAEKCTDIHENVYTVDRIIKEDGHSVLRLPNCINELSLATGVRHLVKVGLSKDINTLQTLQVALQSIAQAINVNKLNGYWSSLIDEEKKLLDLDLKFETIRDTLEAPASLTNQKEKGFDMRFPFFLD